jgi:hypothetical protein
MEFSLWRIDGYVLCTGAVGAMHILGGIQSFTAKMDAVQRYFELRHTSGAQVELYRLKIFKEVREVNAFRNILGGHATEPDAIEHQTEEPPHQTLFATLAYRALPFLRWPRPL